MARTTATAIPRITRIIWGLRGTAQTPRLWRRAALRKRNLLATLMLSQGVPMLLAGDELGHSQGGNNNAYAQDNETTWIDWAKADTALAAFVARLIRAAGGPSGAAPAPFPAWPRARRRRQLADVIWRRADGKTPEPGQWHDPAFRCLGLEVRMSTQRPADHDAVFMVFNMGPGAGLDLAGHGAGAGDWCWTPRAPKRPKPR